MTSTTTFGSSSEASTGSTGTTGLESGFDTSSSTTSSGAECEGDSRCLPTIEGWGGPFEVISSTDPNPPCPGGVQPEWRAREGLQEVMCECTCSPPTGTCGIVVDIHTAQICPPLGLSSATLSDGACVAEKSSSDATLSLSVTDTAVSGLSCASPEPPEASFANDIVACDLPTTGTCDVGDCVPEMLGPASSVCVVRPGDDRSPCPAPYSQRRLAADSASTDALDCSGCGCAAIMAECAGTVSAFSDELCGESLTSAPIGDGDCIDMSPTTVDETAALRYDAELVGECGSEVETAVAQGTPTLLGARTLCCLQ